MSITITAGLLGMLDGQLAVETRTRITGAPEINLASGNAADLLGLLGYDIEDGFGETSADDFTGRVLLAQALLDVTTDDEHGRGDMADECWTDCGRRPGYLAGMLNLLEVIACWAVEHDAVIVWS